MTVEDTKKVDFIGIGEEKVSLLISDHLEWQEEDEEHLYLLQEKLNAYLMFCESGEILESFPKSKGIEIEIEIVLKYSPNDQGNWFFKEAKSLLKNSGIGLVVTVDE